MTTFRILLHSTRYLGMFHLKVHNQEGRGMAKKKSTKKAKKVEMVLVGSKVKAAIKAKGKMMAGDLLEALNAKVHCMIAEAACRADANKRSTVRPHDV